MTEQNAPNVKMKSRLRLRTLDASDGERHASWFELFFDLVFVVAVAQIAKILANDSDVDGVLKYIVIFIPVWWTWVGFTFYADRFETDETTYRALMFAAMFVVTTLALCVGDTFTLAGDTPFVVCYVLVRGILVALYLRSAYYVPLARSLSLGYVRGFLLAIGLWLASLLVPPPVRYGVWALIILIELVTPIFNSRNIKIIPFDQSHIPERLGLFTIIVLGEAVVATTTGVSQTAWTISTIAVAAIGFAMAAAIWWINFDFVEDNAIRSNKIASRFVYLYGHFFIVASIVAVGIGVEHAIKETKDAHLHTPTLALLGGGIAVYLATITLIKLAAENCNLLYARLASIIVSLAMIFAGGLLPPIPSVVIFFLILAIGVWLENRYGEIPEGEGAHLAPCEHEGEMKIYVPRTTEGCEECVKIHNYKWVHLRLCLSCGHVGCCNSSKYNHAEKHFQTENHPVIASLETDESWAWCYVDDRYIPLLKTIENEHNEN